MLALTITARNRVAKVMFSFMSVIVSKVFLPPTTKFGQGYIFTGVCDSVHGGSVLRGVPVPVGGLVPGGAWWRPPGAASAAGGTHPTGMHSCKN